jgi:GntR family transcriptional repressor for pyruvate dehydrogenase complex
MGEDARSLPVDSGGYGQPADQGASAQAKLPERIAWEIAHDVVSDGVERGDMLAPEAEMVEKYGVGRASIREALRILEFLGLIILRPGPGGGPRWIGVDSAHYGRSMTAHLHLMGATFGDVLEARKVIEPVMAKLAAEQATPAGREQLEVFVASPQPSPTMLPSMHLSTVTEFHGLVVGIPRNPVLDLFAQAVRQIYVDRQQGLTFPEAERQRVLDEHVSIAEEILGGRAESAEAMMREHMDEFGHFSEERHPGMLADRVDWW